LRQTDPPHDYGRVLLLWTAARMPGLLDDEQRTALVDTIWPHQSEDDGWSILAFAEPEEWGDGSRADKLRNEAEFENPPSDGHMTGLAVTVLRHAGVSPDDPRLIRAINWLRHNQRESGRWWTRSLNTDKFHFITYSGTCFALLGMASCDALE